MFEDSSDVICIFCYTQIYREQKPLQYIMQETTIYGETVYQKGK